MLEAILTATVTRADCIFGGWNLINVEEGASKAFIQESFYSRKLLEQLTCQNMYYMFGKLKYLGSIENCIYVSKKLLAA